jgi:hypothetical protein
MTFSLCLTYWSLRMKTYGWMDVYIHVFLTSALVGGEWSASRSCRFKPRERVAGTRWIGGWWAQEPVWSIWRRKNRDRIGIRTPTPRSSSPSHSLCRRSYGCSGLRRALKVNSQFPRVPNLPRKQSPSEYAIGKCYFMFASLSKLRLIDMYKTKPTEHI